MRQFLLKSGHQSLLVLQGEALQKRMSRTNGWAQGKVFPRPSIHFGLRTSQT